jgi:ribonuclease P protein component
MKRQNKLKKRKHFNYIYKQGQSKSSKFVKVVFIKSKYKPFKVGFSVSKKIGKSVVRNKVKRRMKEIFYSFYDCISHNNNYIFVAKEGIENLSFELLKQEMKSVLVKAGVYDEKNI